MRHAKNLDLIRNSEGLGQEYAHSGHIVAYLDGQGVPTIAYGHTRGVLHTDVGVRSCSHEQAEAWLHEDVAAAEAYVNGLPGIANLNQNQFDALVDLAFNVGSFGNQLVEAIRIGRDIPRMIKKYCHVKRPGVPCGGACGNASCKLLKENGLVTRRAAEIALFNKKV